MTEKFIEKPPQGIDGWRTVWSENLRYRVDEPSGGFRRALQRFFRRIVRSVSREEEERQRNFNVAALEMLADTRRDLEALHRDIVNTTRDLSALGVELQKFQELLPVAVQRNDALLAALDQKIETIAVRIRDLTTPLLSAAASQTFRDDFLYRRLEDAVRGGSGEVRHDLQPYLEYARKSAPVLDVGCGRGEFLELCRESNVEARGFDTNERSVADLRKRGFNVEQQGVPQCFAGLQEKSVGAILAAHVVEHLPADLLFELFSGAARVLKAGGYLMIETPNAESLAMSGSDFWRDPTHLGPRHAAALTSLAREYGFDIAELRAVNDFPPARRFRLREGGDGATRELVDQLNAVIFGPQDLRLVLQKR